ncbi:hypothetical protein COW36_09920 [bacterium (Candidatus Blackallbacteria) CG17_big_fil_post_rev_8_21_14_2_50_48_46]|uniref:Uncharacterized protein n=1 Tax=bacterium (Candidatus Blackallbacteria) CG17_big_fil_post_rev_8_21_14_2_50_48_46 TaxID=2014261 RepID=A0A2M7G5Q1_9BACT|nr:MAG: hypothetical protein COW64_26050 [bacterium (Candidatus Blackallbacteria) CG18_big_fil_WC_8_21_14_2_50_49_26]PIW17163.1 MAG: hypothetical protein COW36_09920 [bacterium (Candidatus Blackallbacteria) CG17_big_fil_post_rev_8_21_14_2_50_48_46]PIW44489.1 MAG: hypothetical protein COW20_24025 [bacterium (Candidatus Blackallbacteria) CG13_big_fil_rev_8_21_14_2_50_49_14]
MTIGYNNNQAALLAGMNPVGYQQAVAAPGYAPYTPSYTLPIQPAPMQPPGMKVDNYESTRDKNAGDFVAGFFTGAGKAIYDMGHGLFFLGKTAGNIVTHPIKSAQWVGGAAIHAVSHPIQTGEAIVTLPFKVANGIVKPYSQAIQQGRYGEALGRLTVDVTVIAASFGNKPAGGGPAPAPGPTPPPPPPPAPTPVADVVSVVDDAAKVVPGGGVTNNVTSQVGDVLLEKLVNVENVAPGATVNINIGNVEIGKTVMSGTINATSGGGGAMKTVGKMVENADEVAKVVSPQTAYEVAQAVETVTPAAEVVTVAAEQSRTVGQIIGGGIDTIIQGPGKVFNAIGDGFNAVGNGIKNIGNVVLHPLDALKGMNPVNTAEWIGNGLRTGADLTAKGLVFAAQNPKQALIIAGAVGRGGKAAEDILMEFDLVR